jgi:NAD(P)-dependent dehydrogenase (short-subunit alcohol dehydrogenase family)
MKNTKLNRRLLHDSRQAHIYKQWDVKLKRTADANPLKRIGKPKDIAGAVVFLAS